MTLDTAIKYMSNFAEIFKRSADSFTNNNQDNNTMREYYEEQANAHIQIARWLEDYKRLSTEKEQDIYERAYKDGYDKGYDQGRFNGYREAIDDFVVKSDELSDASNLNIYCKATIREIADELKEKCHK